MTWEIAVCSLSRDHANKARERKKDGTENKVFSWFRNNWTFKVTLDWWDDAVVQIEYEVV